MKRLICAVFGLVLQHRWWPQTPFMGFGKRSRMTMGILVISRFRIVTAQSVGF